MAQLGQLLNRRSGGRRNSLRDPGGPKEGFLLAGLAVLVEVDWFACRLLSEALCRGC